MNSDQINKWKNEGYLVLNNIINDDILEQSRNFIKNMYQKGELSVKDFGSNGKLEFPTNSILDHLTLNSNLINIVKTLLNTSEILLVQSTAWGKEGNSNYFNSSNNDQRMHMDYGNNTFLHPSGWNNPEAVAIIIYLSDVNETEGGTSCVPREGDLDELYQEPYLNMPGIGGLPFINDKETAEKYFKVEHPEIYKFRQKLYQREKVLKPNFGDILLYRLDLWHRGTPVKQGKIRFVMNLLYKKKDAFSINCWNPGWTKKMYYGEIEKFITNISPEQRAVLGIPLPGDKYWNIHKIQQMELRYPKIDIEPYLSKL